MVRFVRGGGRGREKSLTNTCPLLPPNKSVSLVSVCRCLCSVDNVTCFEAEEQESGEAGCCFTFNPAATREQNIPADTFQRFRLPRRGSICIHQTRFILSKRPKMQNSSHMSHKWRYSLTAVLYTSNSIHHINTDCRAYHGKTQTCSAPTYSSAVYVHVHVADGVNVCRCSSSHNGDN